MEFILWDDTAAHDDELPTLRQWANDVCPQRAQKAQQYRSTFSQWACLKTFYLLAQRLTQMRMLNANQTLQITFNAHGKPALAQQNKQIPIHFSVSHCQNALLIALHDQPVGADIEHPRTLSTTLLERTMSAHEQQQIRHDSRHALALWTKKEALLKMRGTGIENIDELPQLLHNAPDNAQIRTTQTPLYTFSIAFIS